MLPTLSALRRRRRRGGRAARTWAAPRARRTRSTRSRPVAGAARRAARRAGARSPPTPSATRPGPPWPALADGQVAAAGEPALQRGRDQQGRRRAGRVRRPARRVRRRRTSTTRSARCTASTPASTTCRPGCRTTPAAWCCARSRCSRRLTGEPERPYVVVLGGSKVSDKLAVIEALLPKVDRLLIGGGMCFTFLKAQGHEVGTSLLEAEMVDTCRDLLDAGRRQDRAAGRRGGRGPRSPPTPRTTRCAADGDPGRPARAWTSARRRWRRSPTRWPARRPSSGTARWACSSWRRSPPAPGAWPRRSPRSTAFTRRRRRRLGGGGARARASTRRRSGTSPPAAAPRWSTSRARPSPASRHWRH